MLEKWSRGVVRYRWLVIAVVLVVTVVAMNGLRKLTFYNRMIDWLPRDDPRLAVYINTSEKFAINELVMILIRPHQGIFTPDILKKVKTLTEDLGEQKEIFMVTSLGNATDIKRIGDGIEVSNLMDRVPSSSEEAERFKDYVLSKEMYRNQIVSQNGEWLAVSVFILEKYDTLRVLKETIIPQTENRFKGLATFYFTGIPADGYFVNRFTMRDLTTLVPIMVFLIVIILYLSFRTSRGVLYPFTVVLVSNIWLFGLVGYLKRPLTIVSPAMPVLLIALGSAYGIYVLNKIQHDLFENPHGDQKRVLILATASIIVPIFFAAVTDIIGFLTFRTVQLKLIADFGLFSAVGLFFAMLISFSLIPALSALGSFQGGKNLREHQLSRFLIWMGNRVTSQPSLILLVMLLIFVIFSLGLFLLRREVSFSEFYPKTSHPRLALDTANTQFNGTYPFAFYLSAVDVRSPEVLRLMRRFENRLLYLANFSIPYSIVDLVQELNDQLNDRYAVPDQAPAVSNLWFFVEGRKELNQLVSDNGREAVVFAKIADPATSFNRRLSRELDQFLLAETGEGFVRYWLPDLPTAEQKAVQQAEASFLEDEIIWLGQHYERKEVAKTKIHDLLQAGWQEPLPDPEFQSVIFPILQQYIQAESFDFILTPVERSRLLNAILNRPESERLKSEVIGNILKAVVSKKEYQESIASQVADTLVYKMIEARTHWRVEKMWQKVNSFYHGSDPNFKRRVKSLLYDCNDFLALLPGKLAVGAGGGEVGIDRVEQTGYPVLIAKLADMLLVSQIQSIALAYLVTLVLMIIMRRSVALGFISTIPIIFTSVVMYGMLGFLGIPLDYATMMIGPVSIGVGIDYAIHFIYVATHEIQLGRSRQEAIRRAFEERGRAIVSNSAAVMAGFAVLLVSSMFPLRHFGGTMVISMFLASLAALSVLPAAILLFKPRIHVGRNRQKSGITDGRNVS